MNFVFSNIFEVCSLNDKLFQNLKDELKKAKEIIQEYPQTASLYSVIKLLNNLLLLPSWTIGGIVIT